MHATDLLNQRHATEVPQSREVDYDNYYIFFRNQCKQLRIHIQWDHHACDKDSHHIINVKREI